MSSLITPSLSRYKKVIQGLTPYSGHPKLKFLVEKACLKHYPGATHSVFPSIVGEIKRLSTPCHRAIDLRDYFNDCAAFQHNDIVHHLDEISKENLVSEIEKHNNVLTLITYQTVLSLAKERYLKNDGEFISKNKKNDDILRIEEQPLVNTTFCHSKAVNYTSDSFAFISDRYCSMEPHQLDCVIEEAAPVHIIRVGHGLIRIKTNQKELSPKLLYLKNHHPKININNTIPAFSLSVDVAKTTPQSDGSVFIDLKVNNQLTLSSIKEVLPNYIESRIKANNSNLHEQFTPLKHSILAKAHKQWWNSTRNTYALLAEVQGGELVKSLLLTNKTQDPILDFMNKGQKIGFDTLSRECIRLSTHSNIISNGIVGVSFFNGHYYIETRREFLMTRLWREAVRKGHAYILSFSLTPIKDAPELCYSPSALPSYIGPEFAILNHKTTGKTKNLLIGVNYLLQFSELNSLIEQFPKEDNTDDYPNFIEKTAYKDNKGTTLFCSITL